MDPGLANAWVQALCVTTFSVPVCGSESGPGLRTTNIRHASKNHGLQNNQFILKWYKWECKAPSLLYVGNNPCAPMHTCILILWHNKTWVHDENQDSNQKILMIIWATPALTLCHVNVSCDMVGACGMLLLIVLLPVLWFLLTFPQKTYNKTNCRPCGY